MFKMRVLNYQVSWILCKCIKPPFLYLSLPPLPFLPSTPGWGSLAIPLQNPCSTLPHSDILSRGWGHSLELVDDDHSDVLSGLQDLLQPVDVVRVGVPERDVIGQACDLNGIWAVSDQFVWDEHRSVQAQGLTWKAQGVKTRAG